MTISNFFIPNRQTVQNITNGNPAVVTTTQANGYHNGLFVRIVLPRDWGMQQVNGGVYQVTILSPTTFSINVNTTNFDSFTSGSARQVPQVIPVGEVSSTLVNAVINNDNIVPESSFVER